MQQYGFHFAYRLYGGEPTIREFVFQDSETISRGDLVTLKGGKVDLAATNDTAFLGAAIETVAGTANVSTIRVIVDRDAVYAVYDANARSLGATLDIAGATGAMTLADDANHDVVVVATSASDEPTLVCIINAEHALTKAG